MIITEWHLVVRGGPMDFGIDELHRRANNCRELAAPVKRDDSRQQLLDIARQWHDLAIRIELLEGTTARLQQSGVLLPIGSFGWLGPAGRCLNGLAS